ncbi:MAG: galK [Betaproteobacteria bacterium]|nr:galK [Betaproteobacteria bacterium]
MKSFAERFGARPDTVASAPGRVNLLGEHTDYNDGYVLPASIPQRTRVAMRVAAGTVTTVYSAELDATASFTPGEPPQQQFARYVYGCIEETRLRVGDVPALDIHVESDVPMGVGLSSSAALEVATLRALRDLFELPLEDVLVAQLAQRAEIHHAGVNCGILDQMASSLLDLGSMLFLDTRSLARTLLPLPAGAEVLVVDSGVARSLAASKYNERRAECEEAARRLGVASLRDVDDPHAVERLDDPWRRRARHVVSENARVQSAPGASAEAFGKLMNASHASLRDDYEVSIAALDELAALLQGDEHVYGAKLTGAGFGGACVALCRAGTTPEAGRRVIDKYHASGRRGRVLVPA